MTIAERKGEEDFVSKRPCYRQLQELQSTSLTTAIPHRTTIIIFLNNPYGKRVCRCHLFCAWKTRHGLSQRQVSLSGGQCWTLCTLEQVAYTHFHWKYSKLDGILSWAICSSWSWFEQGYGQCDLKKCLPISTILWSQEHPAATSLHSTGSWSLPLSSPNADLSLSFIVSFSYTHIYCHTCIVTPYTHPSLLTCNILNPNHLISPPSLLLSPRPPSATSML